MEERNQGSTILDAVPIDEEIKSPEIHIQYIETYGRTLLAASGANESVKWPNGKLMIATTTIAISDAFARRKIKSPRELGRALRALLEIGGMNYTDLDRRVSELVLSIPATSALERADIRFVGELVRLSPAEASRVFLKKTIKELGTALAKMNLAFGTDVGDWSRPQVEESRDMGEQK